MSTDSQDRKSPSGVERRHHAPEDSLQRALRQVVKRAGIIKLATVHTLCHSFAEEDASIE